MDGWGLYLHFRLLARRDWNCYLYASKMGRSWDIAYYLGKSKAQQNAAKEIYRIYQKEKYGRVVKDE